MESKALPLPVFSVRRPRLEQSLPLHSLPPTRCTRPAAAFCPRSGSGRRQYLRGSAPSPRGVCPDAAFGQRGRVAVRYVRLQMGWRRHVARAAHLAQRSPAAAAPAGREAPAGGALLCRAPVRGGARRQAGGGRPDKSGSSAAGAADATVVIILAAAAAATSSKPPPKTSTSGGSAAAKDAFGEEDVAFEMVIDDDDDDAEKKKKKPSASASADAAIDAIDAIAATSAAAAASQKSVDKLTEKFGDKVDLEIDESGGNSVLMTGSSVAG